MSHRQQMIDTYSKRKGFAKADEEMVWYIAQMKKRIETERKNQQKPPRVVCLRRSTRIQLQLISHMGSFISTGLRRSLRIAQLQKTVRQ